MSVPKLGRGLLIFLSVPAVVGCSAEPVSQRPKVVPARGMIRFNGKPLEGARVTFAHITAGVSSYGVTDAEGKFTLTTFQPGDGAAPGKYNVGVIKAQEPERHGAKDAPPIFRSGGAPHARWLIPQRYGNPANSGLNAEAMENGDNEIILELKGA